MSTSRPSLVASTTPAIAVGNTSVSFVVGMSVRTMGLATSNRSSISAPYILAGAHGLKMTRPYAVPVCASPRTYVIPDKSFRWRTNKEVMGGHCTAIESDLPVSILCASEPQGAPIRATGIDHRPELLFRRGASRSVVQRDQGASMNTPAAVVHGTPATTVNGRRTKGNATVIQHREPLHSWCHEAGSSSYAASLFYRIPVAA